MWLSPFYVRHSDCNTAPFLTKMTQMPARHDFVAVAGRESFLPCAFAWNYKNRSAPVGSHCGYTQCRTRFALHSQDREMAHIYRFIFYWTTLSVFQTIQQGWPNLTSEPQTIIFRRSGAANRLGLDVASVWVYGLPMRRVFIFNTAI